MEATLKVKGMHCTSCEALVKEAISEVKGAKAYTADSKTGLVRVAYDSMATLEKIKAAIRESNYEVQ